MGIPIDEVIGTLAEIKTSAFCNPRAYNRLSGGISELGFDFNRIMTVYILNFRLGDMKGSGSGQVKSRR